MLTLYFSGTGNTKYAAELFSRKMDAVCLSIEENADFPSLINDHDTLAFCYPVYGSRVPPIMRGFIKNNKEFINNKNIIILITQNIFSGDGARALTDVPGCADNVIYAEHFNMPSNTPVLFYKELNQIKINKYLYKLEIKMERTCQNIKSGISVKRGFNLFSRLAGCIQGIPWMAFAEKWMRRSVRVSKRCNSCGLCARICPVNRKDCTLCFRCVNQCPRQAISIFFPGKPKWQYKGIE